MTCWVIFKQHWLLAIQMKTSSNLKSFWQHIQVEKDGFSTSENGRNGHVGTFTTLVVDKPDESNYEDPKVSNDVHKQCGWTRNTFDACGNSWNSETLAKKEAIQDVVNIIFRPLPKNNFPPLNINILLMITFLDNHFSKTDYYTPEN